MIYLGRKKRKLVSHQFIYFWLSFVYQLYNVLVSIVILSIVHVNIFFLGGGSISLRNEMSFFILQFDT